MIGKEGMEVIEGRSLLITYKYFNFYYRSFPLLGIYYKLHTISNLFQDTEFLCCRFHSVFVSICNGVK